MEQERGAGMDVPATDGRVCAGTTTPGAASTRTDRRRGHGPPFSNTRPSSVLLGVFS